MNKNNKNSVKVNSKNGEMENVPDDDPLSKRIRNVKSKIRKSKSKRERKELSKKLKKLKERFEQKKNKKKVYLNLYHKNLNQVKKALKVMPFEVLQRIIYETPYERLHKKIPEAIKVYGRMRYEWYRT